MCACGSCARNDECTRRGRAALFRHRLKPAVDGAGLDRLVSESRASGPAFRQDLLLAVSHALRIRGPGCRPAASLTLVKLLQAGVTRGAARFGRHRAAIRKRYRRGGDDQHQSDQTGSWCPHRSLHSGRRLLGSRPSFDQTKSCLDAPIISRSHPARITWFNLPKRRVGSVAKARSLCASAEGPEPVVRQLAPLRICARGRGLREGLIGNGQHGRFGICLSTLLAKLILFPRHRPASFAWRP